MPGRNGQVSRIYALLDILEGAPQGLTVNELTARVNERGHEAGKRTVYRDLDALNDAGFPLFPKGDAEDTNATKWVLERLTKVNEHFVLSSRELLALYLARGLLIPLKDTPFYADLDSIFKKIEGRIGTKSQDYFNELNSEFQFEPGPRWGLGIDPDLLETVRACCAEKQLLEVTYASANGGDKRPRRLGPQFLYFAKGSLYLVAEDMEKSGVKVFSVPRMTEAKMLDEEYEGEPVDPQTYFQGTFGVFKAGPPVKVTIHFSPLIAPFVRERRWHETQGVVALADGSIQLGIEVAVTPELVQWVLGFGENATVMEPMELRHKVIESAGKVLEKYKLSKAA